MSPLTEDLQSIVAHLGSGAHRLSGKTVLISGGAGFLGRYFLGAFKELNAHVLERPCRVISLDNYITGVRPGAERGEPHVLHVAADVTRPLSVDEPVHFIIHAAGIASPVYYRKYPLETIESAVFGVKNLLEVARRNPALEGFLYFSSSEIYGDPDPRFVPTPESYHGHVSSVGPRACYDESKRLGETIAVTYHELYGVPVTIVRPFNVFGPGMVSDDHRVVPMFTRSALAGRTIPVHGTGEQTRTFCYITDATTGFLQALISGGRGEAYNIGNAENEIAMRDLAELFTSMVPGASLELIPYPDIYPAGEPARRCPDLSKARGHFGYEAHVSLEQGLRKFIAWARSDPRYLT
jgi:UDP-glucuronate decarboxylase